MGKRRDNGRWQVRYRDPAGRQRSQDFVRKGDADRFRAGVETDVSRGAWIDPRGGEQTFGDWAQQWFVMREPAVRATTYAAQSSVYASLIEPALAKQRLGSISQPTVQAWVIGLTTQRGVAPGTARKAYQVLGAILAAAVDAEQIVKTPCRGIILPADDRREMHFITPAQVATLAATIDARYRVLVLVGAYGGLRVGEMGALRRSGVQLPRGVVRVEETLAEIAGKVAFQPPKTKASRRAVVLPKVVAAALEEHLTRYAPGGPRDLVFRSPEGGPMRLASWRRRFWLPAVARAGLDGFRIHDLRHTAVALWIATGANPKQVSTRAGHTSVSFTFDRYGHLFEDADETLAGLLNAVYDPGEPN